jgi:AraC-like DNA-binding protein
MSTSIIEPFQLLVCSIGTAKSNTPALTHSNYPILTVEFVRTGSGYVEQDNIKREFNSGSVYFLQKKTTHTYRPNPANPWDKIFFSVDGEMVDQLIKWYNLEDLLGIDDVPHLEHYFNELYALRRDENTNTLAAAIFHQFIAECKLALNKNTLQNIPKVLRDLKSAIDSSSDGSFNLALFASKNNYTPAHLIRLYKEYYHTTPGQYLQKRRIDIAHRLLLYSTLSIKEISSILNFPNPNYFSNFFYKHTGYRPNNCRKKTKISN